MYPGTRMLWKELCGKGMRSFVKGLPLHGSRAALKFRHSPLVLEWAMLYVSAWSPGTSRNKKRPCSWHQSSQGSHSSPLNYCQAHRAELWQWNLWQLKPWFCWKEAYILNIHARKLCRSQHYYTQLCLEKERKTDMYIRSRSHELRKKTHNEFKLD